MLIVQLPDDILSQLISDFVDLKDLTTLDSSVTNSRCRQYFLTILSNKVQMYANGSVNANKLSWISLRKIKLIHVCFDKNCFNDLDELIYFFDFSRIKSIIIRFADKVAISVKMINQCTHLRLLKLNMMYSSDNPTFFSQIKPEILNQLTFISELFHSPELDVLSQHCRKLTNHFYP